MKKILICLLFFCASINCVKAVELPELPQTQNEPVLIKHVQNVENKVQEEIQKQEQKVEEQIQQTTQQIENKQQELQQKKEEVEQKIEQKQEEIKQQIINEIEIKKPVSQYDFGVDYDTAITMGKPVVLLFYTNWCSACKRILPLVKMIQEKYQNYFVFTSINAEDTKYSAIVKDYRLRCFPTIYIIDPKFDNRVHLEVSYIFSTATFAKELDRYIHIRSLLDMATEEK